ncbi:hypothetical protein MACH07_05390 [Flagellimonas marinaquae]|uniref:Uncharacterized protein n=1 Tax=Flagellimonas marinaquae TaxID=254955 RepID=A0AA48HC94_9FLAO|nr:hypothetical protein MACH07_05390 [Allomuricauda aquimarina]
MTSRISSVLEAYNNGANKVNNIPEPFTNPACINADAGVGAVIADNNHLWNGNNADWISAAVIMHNAEMIFIKPGVALTWATHSVIVMVLLYDAGRRRPILKKPVPMTKLRRLNLLASLASPHWDCIPINLDIIVPISSQNTINRMRWLEIMKSITVMVKARPNPMNVFFWSSSLK